MGEKISRSSSPRASFQSRTPSAPSRTSTDSPASPASSPHVSTPMPSRSAASVGSGSRTEMGRSPNDSFSFPTPVIAVISAAIGTDPIPPRTFESPNPLNTSSAERAMCSASRPRASTHTNPPRRSSVTTRGATVRRAGERSARESATVRQTGLQRQTNIVRNDRDRDFRGGVPSRGPRPDLDGRMLDLHRVVERPVGPPIAVRYDLRLHPELGQRWMRRDGHERPTTLPHRTRETNGLRALGLRPIQHHQRKPTAPEKLLGPLEGVLPTPGLHEERAILPERADDRSRGVDPDGALAVRDGGTTGRAEHRTGTALR